MDENSPEDYEADTGGGKMLNRRAAHTTIAQQSRKESDLNEAHRTGVVVKRETWPPALWCRHR